MSKISVIIPTYNRAEMLRQAIRSVIAQTYQNFEIIIIDDGSTDDTAVDIENLEDDRIVYCYQNNQGISRARNAGISRATGEYVAFLDSDDIWFPQKLASQIDAIKRNREALFVFCPCYRIGPDNDFLFPQDFVTRCCQTERVENMHRSMLIADCISTPSVLVEADLLRESGGFDENIRYGEDWDLWIRLSALTNICDTGYPLAAFRVHPSRSTGGRHLSATLRSDIKVIEKHLSAKSDLRLQAEMFSYARHAMEALASGLSDWEGWLVEAINRAKKIATTNAISNIVINNLIENCLYTEDARLANANQLLTAAQTIAQFDDTLRPKEMARKYWKTWTHLLYRLKDYRSSFSCARRSGLDDRGVISIAARSALKIVLGQAKGRIRHTIEDEVHEILRDEAKG